jgi:branched-chain amino acid transport system substrate-binding protein
MAQIKRRAVLIGGAAAFASLSARVRAQAATIRLGCLAPLSGTLAPTGIPIRTGAQIAVDQINGAGGLLGKRVELVALDDRADPNQSIAGAQELFGQNINLIVGEPLTANALALAPILKDKNGVLNICGTSDERITQELFIRNWFVSSCSNFTAVSALCTAMANREPNIAVWTALIADNANGHGVWESIAKILPATYQRIANKQIKMVGPAVNKTGTADFKPLVSGIIESGAQGIITQSPGADGITFYQQSRQFNLDKKVKVFADFGLDVDLPNALKKNLPRVCWSKSYYSYPAWAHLKMARDLAKAYAEKMNGSPTHQLGCLGHTAVMGFAAAIKAAGGADSDKVIPALEGLKFASVRDEVYYRKEDHRIVASLNVSRLAGKDGEPGWDYRDMQTIPDSQNMSPLSPGKKPSL